MLERATACINAGARQPETLRCVRHAIRTRRTLHSTFWNHGTSNFDAPPCTISAPSNQICKVRGSETSKTRRARTSQQPLTCPPPEGGVFLDFLYPLQALAYLHRFNAIANSRSQQWESWEPRNARRLPEGFIQASRGYASRSSRPKEQADANRDHNAFDNLVAVNSSSPSRTSRSLQNPASRSPQDPPSQPSQTRRSRSLRYPYSQLLRVRGPEPSQRPPTNLSRIRSSQSSIGQGPADTARSDDAFDDIDLQFFKDEQKHWWKLKRQGMKKKRNVNRFVRKGGVTYYIKPQIIYVDELDSAADMEESEQAEDIDATEHVSEFSSPELEIELEDGDLSQVSSAKSTNYPINPVVGSDSRRSLQELLDRKREVELETPRTRYEEEALRTERAMKLYLSLSDDMVKELPVITALLLWLAERKIRIADDSFIKVFTSLESKHKSSQVFLAAFTVYLRRYEKRERLIELHQEMLTFCSGSPDLFYPLFRDRVQNQDWDSAFHFRNQFFVAFGTIMQAKPCSEKSTVENADLVQKPTPEQLGYWTPALDSAGIIGHIPSVIEWARGDVELEQSIGSQTCHDPQTALVLTPHGFAISFCRHVIDEVTSNIPKLIDLPNQPRHNALLQGLVSLLGGRDANSAYVESVLSRLAQFCSTHYIRWADALITELYLTFRKMPDVRLLRRTLQSMLKWTARTELSAERIDELEIRIDMIVHDWEKHEGALSRKAVSFLSEHYAKRGDSEQVAEYAKYYPKDESDGSVVHSNLWNLIHVHAKRGDTDKAKEAFVSVESMFAKNGALPDMECWISLLEAYRRSNNLEGCLEVFKDLLRQTHLKADERVFQKLASLLAQRGDVESVRMVIEQFENMSKQKRSTRLVSELMVALTQNDELDAALKLLAESLRQHRKGHLEGQLTKLFNIMLSAYAFARERKPMLGVFQLMRTEKIKLDERSYTALYRGLTFHRHTETAFFILRRTMAKDGVRPDAVHFATIMAGFMNEKLYKQALWAHTIMQEMNVRESEGTRSLYLQSKARLEREMLRGATKTPSPQDSNGENGSQEDAVDDLHDSVQITIHELSEHLQENQDSNQDTKLPINRPDRKDFGHNSSAYFSHLAFLYGTERSVQALQELFADYRMKNTEPPLDILSDLMQSLEKQKRFDDVVMCWNIAKDEADRMTRPVSLSIFEKQGSIQSTTSTATEDKVANIDHFRDFGLSSDEPAAKIRLRRYRHILSRPFFYYLRALTKMDRIHDAISAMVSLLRGGYELDNLTWNQIVTSLCEQSPPFALLAFTLTEHFMIRGFPGWKTTALSKPVVPMDVKVGLEHIKKRYLRNDVLLPQYRTLVKLASSFLELRHVEAAGKSAARTAAGKTSPELNHFVGTMKQIRERAAKTLYVVQSMPKIDDHLQRTLLRRENEK